MNKNGNATYQSYGMLWKQKESKSRKFKRERIVFSTIVLNIWISIQGKKKWTSIITSHYTPKLTWADHRLKHTSKNYKLEKKTGEIFLWSDKPSFLKWYTKAQAIKEKFNKIHQNLKRHIFWKTVRKLKSKFVDLEEILALHKPEKDS